MTGAGKNLDLSQTDQAVRNSSGTLAMFAAIRRASSLLSNFAAGARPAVACRDWAIFAVKRDPA
jgi:hypothetical protein